MAIKSETFSRLKLTEADAVRFVQHMREDKPNPIAQAAYARGRGILRQVLSEQRIARAC